MSDGARSDQGLVPLADRLRYMEALRVVVVATVLASWFALPGSRGLSVTASSAIAAGYLTLTLPTVQAWRLRRPAAIAVFGGGLLVDGVYLALVTYGTAGFATPLTFLLLLHVVSVTLLASFRTGMKSAFWHSLLIGAAYQVQVAGYVGGVAPPPLGALVILITAVWLVTLATASFGAVNERELRRRNYDLHALSQFGMTLEATSDADAIANALVDAVSEEFAIERAALITGPAGELVLLASRETAPADATLRPGDDALIARALAENSTIRVTSADLRRDPWLRIVMPGARNIVVVPLHAETQPIGVLVFEHGSGRGSRIERRVVEMVEQFVSQTALALQNAWLLAQIHALAATDGLTGIANRRTFDTQLPREISRAERSGAAFSVVLVDIDHFKRHNDEYGHQQGDETLRRVAQTLAGAGRGSDLAARYGGEEFVVILPGADGETAFAVADRLRTLVAALPGPPVTASFGVASYPAHATTGTDLVRAADAALYRSKSDGRNRVTAAPPLPSLHVIGE